jgi:EAL and modified HD-GYP domain-containing signal transduction protein
MNDNAAHYRFSYQPILNADQASVGVELQFATPIDTGRDPAQAAFVAADAIIHAFIHSGLDDLLRHRRAWVRASGALLGSGLIDLLPPEHFVLCADPSDPQLALARLVQLRMRGFQVALGGAALAGHAQRHELLQATDAVVVDITEWTRPEVQNLVSALADTPIKTLVRRVDLPADFESLRHAGIDLFQGYHFAHRGEASGARLEPTKLTLLDLLAKLSADANDPELDEIFRTDPALSLQLLRLVNSAAFTVHTHISSIKHAFAVLGRRQLTRWLQVLLYAVDERGGNVSPLLELALRRGRFIEYALKYLHHHESSQLQDEAYMTGLLSLADVLIGWPMEKVVEKLHLTETVRAALLQRSGTLGLLLDLVDALEQAEFDRASEIAAQLHLTEEAVMHTQNVALAWANAITQGRSAQE